MKKIVCALAVGIGLSLIGCPDSPGTNTPTTDTSKAPTGDTSKPPEGNTATPAASDKVDLSHVKKGQKYHYKMTNAGTSMDMVYEVKDIVDGNTVKYDITTIMDMGQGPAPVGPPTAQEWKVPEVTATTTTTAEGPKVDISYEKVTVSGVDLNCMVVVSGNTKTWVPVSGPSSKITTFPPLVKTQTDGNTTMELTKIE